MLTVTGNKKSIIYVRIAKLMSHALGMYVEKGTVVQVIKFQFVMI